MKHLFKSKVYFITILFVIRSSTGFQNLLPIKFQYCSSLNPTVGSRIFISRRNVYVDLPLQRKGEEKSAKQNTRNSWPVSPFKVLPLLFMLAPLILSNCFNLKSSVVTCNVISIGLLLLAYLPCLSWGLPLSTIGSWKNLNSNTHRFGGILTLCLPLVLALWEGVTSTHVHPALFCISILAIFMNVAFGARLIPSRIPAYDIPTLRAFAVGILLALSFTSMSLYFRFGHSPAYEIVGKLFSIISVYSVAYAWTDGLKHLYRYCRGDFKLVIGRKWHLPFERSSFKHVLIDCMVKEPTVEALEASVSPANSVTTATTLLTAVFATITLLQLRYLLSGATGMQRMTIKYPHIVRWSCYEALLAVVANNFGTFAGTLVVQNKVDQKTAGLFNALGLMIPVLNTIGLLLRYPNAIQDLISTSFRMMSVN